MAGSVGWGSTESSLLSRRVAWLPPFLVGLAGASAGELATGLLLYSTEGFLRALTVILVTELSALGIGFLTAGSVRATDVDGLRRRWLVSVFAFAAAAIFAGAWGLSPGSPATPLSQGVGLGLLAGLPLFSVGAVLGALASEGGEQGASTAAPASFGAALGLLLTGLYGVPSLQPASLYLFCVVAVSGGALLHGWMTDRRIRVLPLGGSGREGGPEGRAEGAGNGRVRWERRVRNTPRAEVLVVRVEGLLADAAAVDRSPAEEGEERGKQEGGELRVCVPWQRHVLEMIDGRARREDERDAPILLVGIGTGALLSAFEARGYSRIVALEPREDMRRPEGERDEVVPSPGVTVRRGREEVAAAAPPDGYALVVVNLRLLPRAGPFQGPDLSLLEELLASRSDDGIALLGGVEIDEEEGLDRTLGWLSSRCEGTASLFRPEAGTWSWADEPWDDLLADPRDDAGGLLTCSPEDPGEAHP